MYYSASTVDNPAQHCIGAATSETITGPYVPFGDGPLICPASEGGAIDAATYLEGESSWIL